MFNYGIKLRNRSKVCDVIGLELSDKKLSTLLKEVLDSIKAFKKGKLFELMATRKHTYRL